MTTLDYETLAAAVGGTAVDLRARTGFEPLGGPGDKVFPPTYGVPDSADSKYAVEERRLEGQSVRGVILESVAAQGQRHEGGSVKQDCHLVRRAGLIQLGPT
jgi:CRISPR-associated protein Csb1